MKMQRKHYTAEERAAILRRRLVEKRQQSEGSFGIGILDAKGTGISFSVVDHLRWDLKQIFDMAVAEGQVGRNPALLLFTPKEARKPVRRAMTIREVQLCFSVLDQRKRLIAKLALLGRHAAGRDFRSHLATADGEIRRYPAAGVPRTGGHAENRSVVTEAGAIRRRCCRGQKMVAVAGRSEGRSLGLSLREAHSAIEGQLLGAARCNRIWRRSDSAGRIS